MPKLGEWTVDKVKPADVADLVTHLHGEGLARESIRKTAGTTPARSSRGSFTAVRSRRKTLATLAMVLDFGGMQPNPARDRTAAKLPREDRAEVNPPTAGHVEAVNRLLP